MMGRGRRQTHPDESDDDGVSDEVVGKPDGKLEGERDRGVNEDRPLLANDEVELGEDDPAEHETKPVSRGHVARVGATVLCWRAGQLKVILRKTREGTNTILNQEGDNPAVQSQREHASVQVEETTDSRTGRRPGRRRKGRWRERKHRLPSHRDFRADIEEDKERDEDSCPLFECPEEKAVSELLLRGGKGGVHIRLLNATLFDNAVLLDV
jgi:hypothetical protein